MFETIVKELLVKNGHRATVESVPNAELEASIDGKEKGLLQGVKDSMSDQVCRLFCVGVVFPPLLLLRFFLLDLFFVLLFFLLPPPSTACFPPPPFPNT